MTLFKPTLPQNTTYPDFSVSYSSTLHEQEGVTYTMSLPATMHYIQFPQICIFKGMRTFDAFYKIL